MKAIIIGATSGIGLEVARKMHSMGWVLGLAGRRKERLIAIAQEMPQDVFVQPIDVCADESSSLLMNLIARMGGVDLVLIASGFGMQNPLLDESIELATARTNVEGFMRMTTAAFRYFIDRGEGGHIAAITSVAATKGLGASPGYSSTKRFQSQYIQSLSQLSHIKGAGISFTEILPGFVDTAFLKSGTYPMLLKPEKVACTIVRALISHKRKVIIDWRYSILVFFWRLVPNWIWERINVHN